MIIPEVDNFVKICHKIGNNINYVQGAGGNVSIKCDNYIIIKSSGINLNAVTEDYGYSILDYKKILELKDQNITNFLDYSINQKKPSMEIGFHVILGKFVIHTHSVFVNALNCSVNGFDILKGIFPKAIYIEYLKPGFELFLNIKAKLLENRINCEDDLVIFLQNHGLIVSSNSMENVINLHEEINNKIIKFLRIDNSLQTECESGGYKDDFLNIEKILFPDQVVYLDSTTLIAQDFKYIYDAYHKIRYIIEKSNLIPSYLDKNEAMAIANMDEEKYRKQLIVKTNKANLLKNIQYIQHRVNQINDLHNLPQCYGIEIDVRYHNNQLVLCHDPFHCNNYSCLLEDYLKNYKHNILILNLKTEGIEEKCIELLRKYNIKNWAFLDMSMPYFVKYANKAYKKDIKGFNSDNLIVRFSEFETIEYALSFANKVKFIWIDCFNNFPLNNINYQLLKSNNFEIIIVSPELQGHSLDRINEFKNILLKEKIIPYGICTKRIDLWKEDFNI